MEKAVESVTGVKPKLVRILYKDTHNYIQTAIHTPTTRNLIKINKRLLFIKGAGQNLSFTVKGKCPGAEQHAKKYE